MSEIRVRTEQAIARGFGDWAGQPHNRKWVRRIEGTPIGNDLRVCILNAVVADHTRIVAEKDAEIERLKEDLEICMEALDQLSPRGTFGPAVLGNLCEAGRNEVELRMAYADEQRKRTDIWKEEEQRAND